MPKDPDLFGVKQSMNQYKHISHSGGIALSELPVGASGVVAGFSVFLRGKKKFSDIGIIPGSTLKMEAHALFGGLLLVKIMDSNLSLHRNEADNIYIKEPGYEKTL